MAYGARAKRVPARGGSILTDVDIYKMGFVGKVERGFENVQQTSIYSFADYETKCGLYGVGTYYIPYMVESFFKELNSQNNPVEIKVLGNVASDAVQASYAILDQDATPETLFTASAGRKNIADSSLFGNKIALKVANNVINSTMKLTADTDLVNAMALANSLKVVTNAHAADAVEHGTSADGVNYPVATVDATNLATLLTLTGDLLTAYDVHDDDAELGVGWAYHDAQELADYSPASAVLPTTLEEATTRLNDLKAQYNLHDADATAHGTGGTHQEATADAGPTSAVLDVVDGLKVGNYVQFADGTNTEVAIILTIVPATKTITFAVLLFPYTATLTTISRLDVELKIAVKSPVGEYEEKETWVEPMAFSSTIGLAKAVNDTVSGSDYLILAHNAANATADVADKIPAVLSAWTPLTGGTDGTVSNIASTYNTLMSTYFTDTDITFLVAPELASTEHHGNMATWSTDGYKCMYYAHAADEALEAALKNFGGLLRKGITFSMCPSDKWVEVTNPVDGGKKNIPKTAIDAAHWFNTYAKFGESKVAAGNKAEMVLNLPDRLVDTNEIVHDDFLGVGGRLIRDYSINITRFRRGLGVTNNSARTFSSDGGYKYQNQIMQFLLYKKSIVVYLQSIEQNRGGARAQRAHYRAVNRYMRRKHSAGHLAVVQREDGTFSSYRDVCIIVNDFSINTLADLANGIEQIFVQFVAPPPIEEPILQLASAAVTTISG